MATLDLEEWDDSDEWVFSPERSRVRASWAGADQPPSITELRELAAEGSTADHSANLRKLVIADMEMRWRRHVGLTLEVYLAQLPELKSPPESLPDLIVEEYRLRHRFGDQPGLDEYRSRFPEHYDEVSRQVSKLFAETAEPPPERATAHQPATTFDEPQAPPPLAATLRENLTVAGGYRLVSYIGRGAFGEVWRAEAPGGIPVAVKIIRRRLGDKSADRELQALKLIRELAHPFLMQTQAFWSEKDQLLIVMELAEENLRDRLDACQKAGETGIAPEELVVYLRESAEAIDYLHQKRVQHRDIKPDNILVLKNHAKVADFGLAKLQGMQSIMSASHSGTALYMAPEVWRGKLSTHSDQYSLAATYAELRLGHYLYDCDDFVTLMMEHINSKPNLEPMPPEEQKALMRALAKEPGQRYPTCVEFARAMEAAVARKPEALKVPGIPAWVWGLLGSLTVALAVVLGIAFFGGNEPEGNNGFPDGLPEGAFTKGEDAELIQTPDLGEVYDHIVLVKDDHEISFRLVWRDDVINLRSFYMMENMAWNSLFASAWDDPEYQACLNQWASAGFAEARLPGWREGGTAFRNGKIQYLGTAGEDQARLPVLGVSVLQAHCFAERLGGKLPSARQWDAAAGRLHGEKGPYRPDFDPAQPDQIAIKRDAEGPMEVGTASHDVSRYRCRDMAGNGSEWTRSLTDDLELPVATPAEAVNYQVFIRGALYSDFEPYRNGDGGLMDYQKINEQHGFRIVIEP